MGAITLQGAGTAPILRPYQSEVISRVWGAVAGGKRRILLVAPTGAGKTVIAAALATAAAARGDRVLVLAHRRELVHQNAAKCFAAGIDVGVILAGEPMRLSAPVQVASISTYYARAHQHEKIGRFPADLVLVDEAHHATARTWRAIIDAYPDAAIVGLTATPCRGDGRGLGSIFDALIEAATVADLTAAGFLVPARYFAPSAPDMKGARSVAGDWTDAAAAERMAGLTGDIPTHYLRLAPGRRAVCFASGRAHSVSLRDAFRAVGVLAEHVDGDTPSDERDAILRALSAGAVDVVCNAQILTEGFDAPDVGCIILARPTKQIGLFRQMIGRGLRSAPGKSDCVVIDHSGAVLRHGFIDDPIEWTLQPDSRAINATQRSRAEGTAPSVTTCPECHAVRLAGEPCPACGWRPRVRPQHVEVADGELAAVDRNRRAAATTPSREERTNFHRQLIAIAIERGFQRGWAAHKYREKFGTWPDLRDPSPLPPEPATRAWVKSRAIAWAKAQERVRGAA